MLKIPANFYTPRNEVWGYTGISISLCLSICPPSSLSFPDFFNTVIDTFADFIYAGLNDKLNIKLSFMLIDLLNPWT
jgi:hypothetical protein